jgi:hypothetical protein
MIRGERSLGQVNSVIKEMLYIEIQIDAVVPELMIQGQFCISPKNTRLKHALSSLPGGVVVKGAVLQRQLCHQRLRVRAQALS